MAAHRRVCEHRHPTGEPCGAPPIRGETYCFWHHPEYEVEAAEAQRLGGMRSRREKTVTGAYELGEIDTVAGLHRVLEIAILDCLGLDNGIARTRTLGYLVAIGLKACAADDLEARFRALEAAVNLRPELLPSPFDLEPEGADIEFVEIGE
jgi:hypothetical protein